jgi:hypothetical protein
MLFDLRSPHRRRVIKVVYVFLALLIGVGLVGFGIGNGSNFGGLFSTAASGGGSATGAAQYTKALTKAEKQAKLSPDNPAVWITVGKAAYALAVLPTNYLSTRGYSTAGHAALDVLRNAWTKYLALAPTNMNTAFAEEVVAGFAPPPTGVGDYRTAESAQEIVAENQPTNYTAYEYLAYYSWLASDQSSGNLAAAKAKALAPKKDLKQVVTILSEMQAVANATNGTTGATGATGATGG